MTVNNNSNGESRPPKKDVQVDAWGVVKAQVTPASPNSPPESWREVWQRVQQSLRSIACDSLGLLEDTLRGARSIVQGFSTIPAAISRRISGVHTAIEQHEDVAQRSFAIERLDETRVIEKAKTSIDLLSDKGTAVRMFEAPNGEVIVVLGRPDEMDGEIQAACDAMKICPEQLRPLYKPTALPNDVQRDLPQ